MKPLSSIAFISAGILATIISVVPMISPATAQTSTGTDTQRTGTQGTTTQGTGTTTNYERNNDNSGLWGLSGLVGLLGLMGRRKEEDRTTTRRDDAPAYRDPSIR